MCTLVSPQKTKVVSCFLLPVTGCFYFAIKHGPAKRAHVSGPRDAAISGSGVSTTRTSTEQNGVMGRIPLPQQTTTIIINPNLKKNGYNIFFTKNIIDSDL